MALCDLLRDHPLRDARAGAGRRRPRDAGGPVAGGVLWALAALAVIHGAPRLASAQDPPAQWLERLRQVMPAADRFTDRQGQPPVFAAYRVQAQTGAETLIGYAFLTSDLPPEQRGFSGPIEVLVGMDLDGRLTGVLVTRYTESHRATRGDFLAAPGVQEQYGGKPIVDAFRVHRDVDGISGATITVDAMARGIRDAAREVARAYDLAIVNAPGSPRLVAVSVTLDELDRLSWTQLLSAGLSQRIAVLNDDRTVADLTLLYLRDETVAELLIGPDMLAEVHERAGPRVRERHLVVAGVDGPSAGGLNLARLSMVQDGDTVALEPSDVLLFGTPRGGKMEGQFRMTRVLLLDRAVDMTRPATFVFDLRPALGLFSAEYPGRRAADEGGVASEAEDSESLERVLWLLVLLAVGVVAVAARRRAQSSVPPEVVE